MLNGPLKMNLRLIISNQLNSSVRNTSSSVTENVVKSFITNRNPRNLERLAIARKPTGYHLDKKGKEFWHKLEIVRKNKYVIGQVIHNSGIVVVRASSNEFGIGKHLYRANDAAAYTNVARVLAQRCLESGIYQMCSFIDESVQSDKIKTFLEEFEKEGIMLTEPRQYKPITPWTLEVMNKPWKIDM